MTCQPCASTGKIQWTSPPHRDDPRYAYNCTGCSGTGDDNLLSFEVTPAGLAYLNDPPRGGNAAWIKPEPMTIDEFFETFRPIANPHHDWGYNGCMFETHGWDKSYVFQQPASHVWTLIEEDGEQFVSPGIWIINRLGYFITEVPHAAHQESIAA